LKNGDLLFLRHGFAGDAKISWAVEARKVIAQRYTDLDDLADLLEQEIGLETDSFWDDPYTRSKMNCGLVLAVAIEPRFLVDIPWPVELRMPQEGILALNHSDDQLRSWGFLAADSSHAEVAGVTDHAPTSGAVGQITRIESLMREVRVEEERAKVEEKRAKKERAVEAQRNYHCPRCRATETVLVASNRHCRACRHVWLANPR